MSRTRPREPIDTHCNAETEAAPYGPWAATWGLCSVPAPPGLVEGQDNWSHVSEPQLHRLQNSKCCPACFPDGVKNLVKEQMGVCFVSYSRCVFLLFL